MGQEQAAAAATPTEPLAQEMGGNGRFRGMEEERGGILDASCDFCGSARPVLFCRADVSRLCLACDRHVHAANSVSSRHRRALLCDACLAAPAAILCASATCHALLCSNCDFDAHGHDHGHGQLPHERRPVEGFSGCPSAAELFAVLGIGGDEKEVLGAGPEGDDEVGEYLVEDASVWEAQPVLRLVDLIQPNTASHGFQAMAVPSFPKNRNSACGKQKEEIIRQIRELIRIEGYGDDNQGLVEPVTESYAWVPDQKIQVDYAAPIINDSWIAPTFHKDIPLESNQGDRHEVDINLIDSLNPCGEYLGSSSVVNLSSSNDAAEVRTCLNHASDIQRDHVVVPKEKMPNLPLKGVHEVSLPDRNSVLSRYKEKRKTRRYDKLVRYESRKIRADNRLRIKGRFAKMNPSQ